MKTVNDLIKRLQSMSDEEKNWPVVVQAENGLLFGAEAKRMMDKHCQPIKKIMITHD